MSGLKGARGKSSPERRPLARHCENLGHVVLLDSGIPEVNPDLVDLLDQYGDYLAGGAKFLTPVQPEVGTPAAEDLESLLVEPAAHPQHPGGSRPLFCFPFNVSSRSLWQVSRPQETSGCSATG